MIWGYEKITSTNTYTPIKLDISTHCHCLLSGGSGSGKSYALMYLFGLFLQTESNSTIYFCDFKNSEDFSFLNGYSHYYSGNNCYHGIIDYYNTFCSSRENSKHSSRYLLICDEYPALINYLSSIDKQEKTKKSAEILNAISEILMLGRGINFGVWIITQRADSFLFNNGARDNFMITIGLGRLSKEQKGMLFSGEEIPEKIFHQGEGILLADSCALKDVTYPKIRNIVDWKKGIYTALHKNLLN